MNRSVSKGGDTDRIYSPRRTQVSRRGCATIELAIESKGAKATVTRLRVLNTKVGSQSASQCRLAVVPDFFAIPGVAKAAEGKYQVIDEGDLGMGPRRVEYFILEVLTSGELGEYAVEGERVFESPEKPLRRPI